MDAGDRPDYLPRSETHGTSLWWIIALGIAMAGLLWMGLRMYAATTVAWEDRYGTGRAQRAAQQHANLDAAVQRREQLRQVAEAEARRLHEEQPPATAPKPDRCINGTAFKRLPDGGWANMPGVRC